MVDTRIKTPLMFLLLCWVTPCDHCNLRARKKAEKQRGLLVQKRLKLLDVSKKKYKFIVVNDDNCTAELRRGNQRAHNDVHDLPLYQKRYGHTCS